MTEIALVTNFPNHYQWNFAEAMRRKGCTFWLITTEKVPIERLQGGFSDEFENEESVIYAVDNQTHVSEIINRVDLVIAAYNGLSYVRDRICKGSLTLILSERFFKSTGNLMQSYLTNLGRWVKYLTVLRSIRKKCYFLLIGPYAVADHLKCRVPLNRIMKFGYFPARSDAEANREYAPEGAVRFLWVGRMISWKHPEYAARLVERLSELGYDVRLTYIGHGLSKESVRETAKNGIVDYAGALSFNEVRKRMRDSDVLLFTSDYAEGWGCVLNEAMSEGCVPIASVQAGATAALVKDGENGWIYDGTENNLLETARKLMDTPKDVLYKMGLAARKVIEERWNADVASDNLLIQFDHIIHGEPLQSFEGPCDIVGRDEATWNGVRYLR